MNNVFKEFPGTLEDLAYIVQAVVEEKKFKAVKRCRDSYDRDIKESKKYVNKLLKYNRRLLYEGFQKFKDDL